MRPVLRYAFAAAARRRAQTGVIATVALLAAGTTTVALNLMLEANAPFERAFDSVRGAHLAVTYDGAKVTADELAATARLSTVTAAAGPYDELVVDVTDPTGAIKPVRLVARSDPGGQVDALTLDSGRWAQHEGEVVLSRDVAFPGDLGHSYPLSDLQGTPALTVVGIAQSVTNSADGWTLPSTLATIRPPGGNPERQMLYRLRSAFSDSQVAAGLAQIQSIVPARAVLGSSSWLLNRTNADTTIATMVPFLLAFAAFGLLVSGLITAGAVSGAVIAEFRSIGLLKAVGFAPVHVGAAMLLRTVGAAIVGGLVGVVLGSLLTGPILAGAARSFNVPDVLARSPGIALIVVVGLAVLVAGAAAGPAVRAARLSVAGALAAGTHRGRGARVGSALAQVPLPRMAVIGAAGALARPGRTLITLVAIAAGAATVAFSSGLYRSLSEVAAGVTRAGAVQVVVDRADQPPEIPPDVAARKQITVPPGGFHVISDAATAALIQRQAGTDRFVAARSDSVVVPGVAQPIDLVSYRGDATWTGYPMIAGRWYSAPGEAVAPTPLLQAAGTHVGDSLVMTFRGRTVPVRIVGEILDIDNNGLALVTDWSTAAASIPGLEATAYEVHLKRGTDPLRYATALQHAAGADIAGTFDARPARTHGVDTAFRGLIGLILALGLILVVVAGIGVFNTTLLDVRERARQIAILKAAGMSPGQVVGLTLTGIAVIGAVAGLAGLPAGVGLHHVILQRMAAIAGSDVPPLFFAVFTPGLMAAAILAGVLVALAGAVLPAIWAATTPVASVLRSE